MKRMGSWVFDVSGTRAIDMESSKGLRTLRTGERWAVVLFLQHQPTDYLCILEWAEDAGEASRRLAALVEELSHCTVQMDRIADQMVPLLIHLRDSAHANDARLRDALDRLESFLRGLEDRYGYGN